MPRSRFGGVLVDETTQPIDRTGAMLQQPAPSAPQSKFGGVSLDTSVQVAPEIPPMTPEQQERARKYQEQRKQLMQQKMKQLAEETGIGEAAAISFATGLLNVWHGGKEVLAKVTGDDAALQRVQQDKAELEELMAPLREAHPISTTIGEAGGEMAPFAPFGVAAAGAKTMAGRVLGAGAVGAMESGTLAGGDIEAAGGGSALAMGAELGMELFAPRIGKVFKNLTGKALKKAPIVGDRISPEVVKELADQGFSIEDLAKGVKDSIDRDLYPELNDIAKFRQSRAEEFGFDLSAGQAAKDFAAQEAESVVLGSPTAAGEVARGMKAERLEKAAMGAREKLLKPMRSSIDLDFEDKASNYSKREFGRLLKSSAQELKTRDKAVINELYKVARELPGEDIGLDAGSIEDLFYSAIDEIEPDQRALKSVKQTLAKYGVIGENPTKKGAHTVVDFDGEKISFLGDVEQYSLNNSEAIRQRLNKAFRVDDTGLVGVLTRHIDQEVGDTIEDIAERGLMQETGVSPEKIAKFREARKAYRKYKSDYEAGDIVQDILSIKKGTEVPKVAEEEVFNKIFKSSRKIENISRIKWTMKNNPTDASKQTWRDMQAIAIEDMLKQAVSKEGTLSGARLNTAVEKFGNDTLKELLDKDQYRTFKAFQQALGDLTIPLGRTQNVSESGQRVLNMMFRVFDLKAPGAGSIIKRSTESKAAKAQLTKGLESVKGTTGKTRLQKGAEVARKALMSLSAARMAVPEEQEE